MSRWRIAIRGAVLAALVLGAPAALAQHHDGGGRGDRDGDGDRHRSRSVPLLDPALAVAAAAVVAGGGAWIARRRRR